LFKLGQRHLLVRVVVGLASEAQRDEREEGSAPFTVLRTYEPLAPAEATEVDRHATGNSQGPRLRVAQVELLDFGPVLRAFLSTLQEYHLCPRAAVVEHVEHVA